MINFTHVNTPYFPIKITYSDTILSLGSCFSVNMANKLGALKYKIYQNPSGITFNPASLNTIVKMLYSPNSLHQTDSQCHMGLWSHPDFHSTYNHPNKDQHHHLINESLKKTRDHIQDVTTVMITLGTAYVYRFKATGRIVNNCHKRPAVDFDKELMTVKEISAALDDIKTTIDTMSNNEVNYILSVSPVRHIKNGLVEDRHSKSLLLVATHDWVSTQAQAHYFPAYEIITDELRDYRYYADDLIHPSQTAIDAIFKIFNNTLLSEEEAKIRDEVQNLVNRENHRALFPETTAHQNFLAKLQEDRKKLKERYPFLSF